MKITKHQLEQLIQEELKVVLNEITYARRSNTSPLDQITESLETLGGRYETHSQVGETYDVLPSEPIGLIFRGLEGLEKVTKKLSADRPMLEDTIQYQIHTLKREIISKINNTWNKPDYMGDESC